MVTYMRFPRGSTTLAAMLVGALAFPAVVGAQEHGHRSPYAGHEHREIAALSPDEVEALLAGEGMGLALAAELNGYPGPRHVLDMADELELDAGQRERTRAIFDVMQARARALGREVVELERGLDRLFAGGEATPEEVRSLLDRIGERRAHLRDVHLQAHLRLRPVLTEEQRDLYARLRGYGTGAMEGGLSRRRRRLVRSRREATAPSGCSRAAESILGAHRSDERSDR